MSDFTLEDLRKEIWQANQCDGSYGDVDEDVKWEDALSYGGEGGSAFYYEFYDLPTLGTPEQVAYWNGGDGHEMGVVFKVQDRYFKKTGYYSSWDSSGWDSELQEVEPYEVVKIRYRPI